ncbi:MAG: hypothetical protein AAFX10_15460 [Pseudomonadota bacterium]
MAAVAEERAYVIGGGAQFDSADGVAGSAFGSTELSAQTWLTGSLGRTNVELPRRQTAKTWYADVGVDHHFNPAGIRAGLAYWGDSDFFDSIDVRGSFYVRSDWGSLSFDTEHRSFELDIPAFLDRPARDVNFHAFGAGLSSRFDIAEDLDIKASFMSYDYDVDLSIDDSGRLSNLLTISRLSLLSSLIDWRVSAGIGKDIGQSRLEFDIARWRGSIDGSDNLSLTAGFVTPASDRTDVEIRLGFDDSDLYGEVTVLSLFVYFYGLR